MWRLPFVFWLGWYRVTGITANVRRNLTRTSRKGVRAVKRQVLETKVQISARKRKASRVVKDKILLSSRLSKSFDIPQVPYPELLCSNIPPSERQIVVIHGAISSAKSEIERLRGVLRDESSNELRMITRHKLDYTHRFVCEQKIVLSPIRQIPLELLQEIFIVYATSLMCEQWGPLPMTLAQVCRTWRNAAFSVSTLWNKLPIVYLRKRVSKGYIKIFKDILERSGDAPLNVSIYAPFREYAQHPMLDLLVQHSDRWCEVDIDTTAMTLNGMHRIKGNLSMLTKLSLDLWRTSENLKLDLFEVAPQLREVHIEGTHPGDIMLPFSQLTRFRERVRGRGVADQVIASSSDLTTLTIARYESSALVSHASLNSLVTLHILFDNSTSNEMLDSLTLPALEEAKIAGYSGPLLPSLISLIQRSDTPCLLKRLAFRTTEMAVGDVTSLLRRTPLLTELNMDLPPLEDLIKLVPGNDRQLLVPSLESLVLNVDTIQSQDMPETLNKLAISRCEVEESTAFLVPGELRRLKNLRILFDTPTGCHHEHRFLEGWDPSDESNTLHSFREQLVAHLPELEYRRGSRRKRAMDFKWTERVTQLLAEIEDYTSTLGDPAPIYISEIHVSVSQLAKDRSFSKFPFKDRASAVLDAWAPLFKAGFPGRRWAVKGPYSLVYLSVGDAFRNSPDVLDLAYGLKDEVGFSELFWPMYMLYG